MCSHCVCPWRLRCQPANGGSFGTSVLMESPSLPTCAYTLNLPHHCSPAPMARKAQERRPRWRRQRSNPTPGRFSQGAEPFPLQTPKTLVLAPSFPPACQSPQAACSHGWNGAGVEWRKDQKTLDRKVWSHLISNISQQSVNMIQRNPLQDKS